MCWRRREKISWTDRVRNEEALHRVKQERNILHTIKEERLIRGAHLHRNRLIKDVIDGKIVGRIQVTGRQGRRRKQLPDALKANRIYWKLKDEALDSSLSRSSFRRDCGPVVIQTTE
jgi:hypothetical protein